MKRLFALILVGLSVAGCKSQAPVADPFFGRTTIPPPPTGSVTGRPADPGYQPPPLVQTPSPAASNSSPPVIQMPSQPTAQSAPSQPPATATTTTQPAAPSGFTPNYSAPRPSSTAPNSTLTPRSSPLAPAPGSGSLYSPPGGSFNYRGTSTRGSIPSVPAYPNSRAVAPSFTNAAATRTSTSGNDRMPRPVDDTAADMSLPNRKPIIRTIQPRISNDASNRAVDIMDLPKTP